MFKSLVYFELVFVYGVRWGSNFVLLHVTTSLCSVASPSNISSSKGLAFGGSRFVLLHVNIQFSLHDLLKKLSFFACQKGVFEFRSFCFQSSSVPKARYISPTLATSLNWREKKARGRTHTQINILVHCLFTHSLFIYNFSICAPPRGKCRYSHINIQILVFNYLPASQWKVQSLSYNPNPVCACTNKSKQISLTEMMTELHRRIWNSTTIFFAPTLQKVLPRGNLLYTSKLTQVAVPLASL